MSFLICLFVRSSVFNVAPGDSPALDFTVDIRMFSSDALPRRTAIAEERTCSIDGVLSRFGPLMGVHLRQEANVVGVHDLVAFVLAPG